jgi:hypothetical protein
MLTKLLAGGVLTLVMGASLFHLYNPSGFSCCGRSEKSPVASSSSCCSTQQPCCSTSESCCTVATTAAAPGTIYYCPETGEFYDECCCTIVNGQYVCNVTGTVSAECCCYPISD